LATAARLELDETDDHVIIRAEVPGLDPKQLKVEVRNGMLHVSYEHETEWRPNNGEGSGRRYAAFHRTVALPEGVDASGRRPHASMAC
jgi:HSP20 family protein